MGPFASNKPETSLNSPFWSEEPSPVLEPEMPTDDVSTCDYTLPATLNHHLEVIDRQGEVIYRRESEESRTEMQAIADAINMTGKTDWDDIEDCYNSLLQAEHKIHS